MTTREQNRASAARCRTRDRAFIAEVNARTTCAHCGAQPVEWHNPEHVELHREGFRISALVSQGRAIGAIETELARCTPLCRRCHMREDGRLAVLLTVRPLKAGDSLPPKPCSECGREAKPLRKSLCKTCYDRALWRRKSPTHGLGHNSVKTHCPSGHPYDEANTYRQPSTNHRQCLACNRARRSKSAPPNDCRGLNADASAESYRRTTQSEDRQRG